MEKKVLLIIASKDFQPVEYRDTKKVLEEGKIKVVTASDKSEAAISTDGHKVHVDITLDEVKPDAYDGIFLIGGAGALKCLDNKEVYKIMNKADDLHIIYGSICISTRILANADVIRNKRVTGWDGDGKLKDIVEFADATYLNLPVVADENLITAEDPRAAKEFGQEILNKLR